MGKHRNVPAPMAAEQSTQGLWTHLSERPSQLLWLVGPISRQLTRPPFRTLTAPAPPQGPSTGSPLPPLLLAKGVKETQSLPTSASTWVQAP